MDQNLTYYALRHKLTQKLMPARMTAAGGKGWSWWDPVSADHRGYGSEPRLFGTVRGARTAARMWLKGRVGKTYDGAGEFIGLTHEPAPDRKPEDLEIVTVTLTEVRVEPAA